MLNTIRIQHFKSLGDVYVEFSPITILVGPNGSGKSNVVDAIRFIRDMINHGLDHAVNDRGGISIIRQYSPTRPYVMSFQLNFSTHVEKKRLNHRYSIRVASSGDESRVEEESAEWVEPNVDWEQEKIVTKGTTRRQLKRDRKGNVWIDGEKAVRQLPPDQLAITRSPPPLSLVYWHNPIIDIFSGTRFASIYPNILRAPARIDTERLLREDCSNWGSIVRSMRQRRPGELAIKKIIRIVQKVMPNLETIKVRNAGGYMIPQFGIRDELKGRTYFLDPSQLSDGTLRLFALLLALYQVPPATILALEEPEQTVHPGVLGVLAESFREASQTTQILLTTHSPFLLDWFNPEDIRVTFIEKGETVLSNIRKSQLQTVKDGLMSLSEVMAMDGLKPEKK